MAFEVTISRGKIIEDFINLEDLIGSIICQHFFGEVRTDFMDKVLLDEYFSFALKRRLVQKLVKNFDKSIIEQLNRLNTIRNYFAHCGGECFDGLSIPEPDVQGYTPDPRQPDKSVNFEELYKEFYQFYPAVNHYLFNTFTTMSGKVILPE